MPILDRVSVGLRQTVRHWRKAPGFTVVCVLSLALGIAASATVSSVIYGALIDPYPYRGADRMVQLRLYDQSGRHNYLLLSARQFLDFRKLDALDGAVAMDSWDMASTGEELPEAVNTAHLSSDAFDYFGVPAVLGREFSAAPRLGADPEHVVVLGYSYWQRRYGGSRDVVGKTLQLDHRDYTIAGVVPPRFRWGLADVYKPLAMTSDQNRIYQVDARLKAGITNQRAAAEMQPLLEQFARETPDHFPPHFRVHVDGLTVASTKQFRGTLFLLFAAVGTLLAIGCANISILLLAQGTARAQEFAVRAALGASRGRLIAQLLTESAALASAGGAAGVLLAIAGVRAIVAWLPEGSFPAEAAIRLNIPVLLFSALVAMVTGIGFGISPALRFSSPRLNELIQAASRRATPGAGSRRAHDFLVASQVALTILLLAAAGASIRGFLNAYQTRLGYNPRHVLVAHIGLPDGAYTKYEARKSFYRRIHERVAALPSVMSASVNLFGIPPEGGVRQDIEVMGRTPVKDQTVDVQQTTGEYFAALGIPLLGGRVWSDRETDRAAHVAVINQTMARMFWPKGGAVGRRFRLPNFTAFTSWILGARGSNDWMEVIGVAGDTPNRGLREAVAPGVYVPYTLLMGDSMGLVIRTEGAPLMMVRAVREQVRSVDPGQPVRRTETAEDLLRKEGWTREQFVATLFLLFGAFALALAATGLYSVISYATATRSHEFGIRMALGARRGHVIGLVFRSASRTVGAGALAGFALSLAANGLLARWISASVYDPVMMVVVTMLLATAGGLAAFIPARRAASADPMQALRSE